MKYPVINIGVWSARKPPIPITQGSRSWLVARYLYCNFVQSECVLESFRSAPNVTCQHDSATRSSRAKLRTCWSLLHICPVQLYFRNSSDLRGKMQVQLWIFMAFCHSNPIIRLVNVVRIFDDLFWQPNLYRLRECSWFPCRFFVTIISD